MRCNAMRLVPALLLAAGSAAAMSFRDAGENLLYFEHARASTEHCEQRGFAVRAAYDDWQRMHQSVQREALDAVRAEGAARGLPRAEQEAVLAQALANQRRLAMDHIAGKGVNCRQFGEWLHMFSVLLKR